MRPQTLSKTQNSPTQESTEHPSSSSQASNQSRLETRQQQQQHDNRDGSLSDSNNSNNDNNKTKKRGRSPKSQSNIHLNDNLRSSNDINSNPNSKSRKVSQSQLESVMEDMHICVHYCIIDNKDSSELILCNKCRSPFHWRCIKSKAGFMFNIQVFRKNWLCPQCVKYCHGKSNSNSNFNSNIGNHSQSTQLRVNSNNGELNSKSQSQFHSHSESDLKSNTNMNGDNNSSKYKSDRRRAIQDKLTRIRNYNNINNNNNSSSSNSQPLRSSEMKSDHTESRMENSSNQEITQPLVNQNVRPQTKTRSKPPVTSGSHLVGRLEQKKTESDSNEDDDDDICIRSIKSNDDDIDVNKHFMKIIGGGDNDHNDENPRGSDIAMGNLDSTRGNVILTPGGGDGEDEKNKNSGSDDMSDVDEDDLLSQELKNRSSLLKCSQCKNDFEFMSLGYDHEMYKLFIHEFVCKNCTTKKSFTKYKCLDACTVRKEHWKRQSGINNLHEHLRKHHDHIKIVRQLLNLKYCDFENCIVSVQKNVKFCKDHDSNNYDSHLRSMSKHNHNSNSDDNEVIVTTSIANNNHNDNDNNSIEVDDLKCEEYEYKIDKNNVFNLNKLFDFVSIDPDKCTRGITNKTRIANAFTDALKDLANMNSNLSVRSKIEQRGICKLKFIAGTYCYKSYRSSMNSYNKLQREKRHQLYMKQKWNQLYQSIHQEQQRLNDKVGRRIHRQIESNASKNSRNSKNDKYKLSQKINYKNFKQAGKNLLYSTMDSMPDAANRMNRCIKMAKKGCWKKADNALNPTTIANTRKQ